MRVITGFAKGRNLISLDGEDTRPTTDRVKEALFSSLQFDIEGRRVLDLFAGSGQLGIECLSRGAKTAVFVDSNKKATDVIIKNLHSVNLINKSVVVNQDSLFFLSSCTDTFDIAFLDPPYSSDLLDKVLPTLPSLMSDFGIVVCEHSSNKDVPDTFADFKISKQARYGKISLTVYRRERL